VKVSPARPCCGRDTELKPSQGRFGGWWTKEDCLQHGGLQHWGHRSSNTPELLCPPRCLPVQCRPDEMLRVMKCTRRTYARAPDPPSRCPRPGDSWQRPGTRSRMNESRVGLLRTAPLAPPRREGGRRAGQDRPVPRIPFAAPTAHTRAYSGEPVVLRVRGGLFAGGGPARRPVGGPYLSYNR
jgi:hypothetical protein